MLSTARPLGSRAARAEVRLDDPRVTLDLARGPFRDLLAVVQHGHPVGHLHDDAHVVLDQDDGEPRSEEHTSELQSLAYLVCRLLLEKKKKNIYHDSVYNYVCIYELCCALTRRHTRH